MSIQYPDGHVLLRNLTKKYPVISHGRGIELFDQTGKRYLDACGGALVVTLGHGNIELVQEITEQMNRVAYVNGMQFTSPVMEECAANLAKKAAPLGLSRVALLSSGSEAVEAAFKFARQLCVDRGQPKRTKLISRTPGYHGNTLYALSASGRPHYKKLYGPMLSDVLSVSCPYGYRAPVEDYNSQGSDYYIAELERLIEKEGADTIFAFVFETISGSSTGGWAPPEDYFSRVSELCKKHGIITIADEVLCGSGRTGRFFAAEHFGLKPDVLVLGKGLNSGYLPVSAVLVKEEDLNTMKQGSGYFMHAQTYLQAPSMAASANAVLRYIDRHDTLKAGEKIAADFQRMLREQLSDHPLVGCVTGTGWLAGIELVEDKEKKTPFARSKKIAERFVAHAQENGVIFWPNVGQANGIDGDLFMMGPPINSSTAVIEEVVAETRKVLDSFAVN
jgi:adenosylmethionine-8-amino-7-oxononanoate aminotransferase